jgi:hypothetical protein
MGTLVGARKSVIPDDFAAAWTSAASVAELERRYDVSGQTLRAWRTRLGLPHKDRPYGPLSAAAISKREATKADRRAHQKATREARRV